MEAISRTAWKGEYLYPKNKCSADKCENCPHYLYAYTDDEGEEWYECDTQKCLDCGADIGGGVQNE